MGAAASLYEGTTLCAMLSALCKFFSDADGEFDQKGGPFGLVVPDPNVSMVVCDDHIHNRQTQARPRLSSRKIRLEQSPLVLVGNPAPVITHFQPDHLQP